MKSEILSIIPAKGFSSGLSGKNLRLLNGKPLVAWTIEASVQSRYITRTIVSSDSDEVLSVSADFEADVIKRPSELASDTAGCESVMEHAVNYLREAEAYNPDVLVLLQPTSPLRTYRDVDGALELYYDKNCSAVISGYELERNPLKEFLIGDDGNLIAILDDRNPFMTRQELPCAFRPNGAIYVVDAKSFMQTQSLLADNTRPFSMPKERSVDIDNIEDLQAAKSYLSLKGVCCD